MKRDSFQISSSTVYRPMGDKLVVVHAESGRIFHYSLASLALFDRLRTPQTLERLSAHFAPSENTEARRTLTALVDLMWQQELLSPASANEAFQPTNFVESAENFAFLSAEERKLEDVMLVSCPPNCT